MESTNCLDLGRGEFGDLGAEFMEGLGTICDLLEPEHDCGSLRVRSAHLSKGSLI